MLTDTRSRSIQCDRHEQVQEAVASLQHDKSYRDNYKRNIQTRTRSTLSGTRQYDWFYLITLIWPSSMLWHETDYKTSFYLYVYCLRVHVCAL